MALDYTLAVIGETSPRVIAERLGYALDGFERVKRSLWRTVEADGLFILTLYPAKHGYFQHDDWEYEPKAYLSVGFRLDKFRSVEAMAALHAAVGRALSTGDEDMVFVGPGGEVLFHRADGVTRRGDQLTA